MSNIRNVYTVGQLNAYVKNMFRQDYLLQRLLVKGEVSNCKYHPSGHIYFTLKDPTGTVSCIMFAGNRSGLSFSMKEGQQIIVSGNVDVYEKTGAYQIYVREIVLDGDGALYVEFEKLKKELEELGMFAQQFKQPIPQYIRTLGVVTADTGAAVRDIINIARRRNPYVQIILYPALVQGEGAVASIVNGIHALENYGVDVMIVGRGGGSIEDLWAFNEREVAQAIFDCSVPIISAVGHETDTTIADYVADLRAPTPSAAAELAVKDVTEIFKRISDYNYTLNVHMDRKLARVRSSAETLEARVKAFSPDNKLATMRITQDRLYDRLQEVMNRKLQNRQHQLAVYAERMKGLSPLEKLTSGFSYVETEDGRNVKSIADISKGEVITVKVTDGDIVARVEDTVGGTYGGQ